MKNPCEDNCILRVVCTEVCNSKNNYGILLKTAVEQNTHFKRTSMGHKRIIGRTRNHTKYDGMLTRHGLDLMEIKQRKQQKEGQNV
jgi:hypothetical protein